MCSRRQFRIRTAMQAIVVAAVGFWFLRLPGAWLLVAGPLVMLGVVLIILLGAMGLALLGFRLFAMLERAIERAKQWSNRPRPVDK